VPTVLFYRDFRRFTGGDLKVWDYFNHVRATPGYEALVRFSDESVWDETNPWHQALEHVVPEGAALDPDVHFVSGVDWRQIDPAIRADSPVPVVNLIQHVKHACRNDALLRYRFLPHRAVRICVSPEVTAAIEATGTVHGPVFTIPDAVDVAALERMERPARRDLDLVIAANKQPQLGARIAERLSRPGRTAALLDTRIPRPELLSWLLRARVAVLIPNPKEGFYLPAIEAMALGAILVCPDCVGNRSFCEPGSNCFRPAHEEDAIVADAESALAGEGDPDGMAERARATARLHDLAGERRAFQDILARLDSLWAATGPVG
jgi:glycosyltransferase involved in cell wall biosynthesis